MSCQADGFSAEECGTKSWPETSKRRRLNSPIAEESAVAENQEETNSDARLLSIRVAQLEAIVGTLSTAPTTFRNGEVLGINSNPVLDPLNLAPHTWGPESLPFNTFNGVFDETPHDGIGGLSTNDAFSSFPDSSYNRFHGDLDTMLSLFRQKSPAAINTVYYNPISSIQEDKFGGLDSPSFQTILSECTSPASANSITEYLKRHIANGPMTALGASMIQPFTDRYAPWPLLTWREGDHTDVMAIFKVDNQDVPCSCLMHYGVDRCFQPNVKRWKMSSVAWVAASLEHMQELFLAASHVSGISQGAEPEFRRVLGENDVRNCSREDLSLYARNLVSQVSRMRQLKSEFDAVSQSLENFSSKEVVYGRDGQQYPLLRASVEYHD